MHSFKQPVFYHNGNRRIPKMRKSTFRIPFIFYLFGIAFLLHLAAQVSPGAYKTYIIALDSFRGDYIGMSYNGGAHNDADITPTLTSLKNDGTSFKMWDVMPAFTATNHTAIVTSAKAGKSGVYGAGGGYTGLDMTQGSQRYGMVTGRTYVHNDLHVRGIQTIYNAAKNSGAGRTAVVSGKNWVAGILDDGANDNTGCDLKIYPGSPENPNYITATSGYIIGGPPHLGDAVKTRFYVPPPNWNGVFPLPNLAAPEHVSSNDLPSDSWVIDNAISVVDNYDPDLFYILVGNVDEAGHAYGALIDGGVSNLHNMRNPDAVRDQIVITDGEVNRFINHLKNKIDANGKSRYQNSIILITADHGMSSMKKGDYAIDIRKQLEDANYPMKAKDNHVNNQYDPNGVFEYCFSEGPTAYIFGIDQTRVDVNAMENFLRNNLDCNEPGVNPVANVYRGDVLSWWFGGPPSGNSDLKWPQIIVVFKPNYAAYIYGDEIEVGMDAFHMEVDLPNDFKDFYGGTPTVRATPGEHGSEGERLIPCILIGPGVAKGVEKEPQIFGFHFGDAGEGLDGQGWPAVPKKGFYLDISIAPTICTLNQWQIPGSFETSASLLQESPGFLRLTGGTLRSLPQTNGVRAEFYKTNDLAGGTGWTMMGYDNDPCDAFSVEWYSNSYPEGDYLIRAVQYPPSGPPVSDTSIHLFSTPYSKQVLLHDSFNSGDVNNWVVSVSNGQFETTASYYKSSPYGLKMYSQSSGYAYGRTANLNLDTTQDFTVAAYFMVPNTNNHWFAVLDNNWVHLIIDYNTDLKAWQGAYGGILPIMSLTSGQWYWIRAQVHPSTQTYDIYIDGIYRTTANFLRDPPGTVLPYVRLGDMHNGSTDHGECYWDGVFVIGSVFVDNDGDGVGNTVDNCRDVYNPAQDDRNFDGLGDACECEAANRNSTGSVNFLDYAIFAPDWLVTSAGLAGDVNGDGVVDNVDLEIIAYYWLNPCSP